MPRRRSPLAACGDAPKNAATSANSSAGETLAAGDKTEEIDVGGVKRSYVIRVPDDLAANPPAMLMFHGNGGTGVKMAWITGMDAVADANRFIVVYPNGIGNSWNDGRTSTKANAAGADDIGFTTALIARLVADHHVDPRRVYAAGGSNGGAFTQRVGCELADKVAAIASAGGPMTRPIKAACQPARPLPVLLIQGTADPIVAYNDMVQTAAAWRTLNGCAETTTTTQLPDKVSDGTHVSQAVTAPCKDSSQVVFYTIAGAGHTWAGGQQYAPVAAIGKTSDNLNDSQVMWDFFTSAPK